MHLPINKQANQAEFDSASFLNALQISDSFFPTGMVTLSHALETFVDEEGVNSVSNFKNLLEDYLRYQIGVTDSIALANSHKAAIVRNLPEIVKIDWMLGAVKFAKESRDSSIKSGRRMLEICDRLTSDPIILGLKREVEEGSSLGNYAVVLGVLSSTLGIPCQQAILIELYSFAVSFLGAAMRLGRLNYLEVQDTLKNVTETMLEVAAENIDRSISEMRSFTPSIDIMGMKHERAERRLFIS